jgi:hypothetical protein
VQLEFSRVAYSFGPAARAHSRRTPRVRTDRAAAREPGAPLEVPATLEPVAVLEPAPVLALAAALERAPMMGRTEAMGPAAKLAAEMRASTVSSALVARAERAVPLARAKRVQRLWTTARAAATAMRRNAV